MLKKSCFLLLLSVAPHLIQAQLSRDSLLKEYNRLDSICNASDYSNLPLLLDGSKQLVEIAHRLQVDTLMLHANQYYGQALEFVGALDAALKTYYASLPLAERQNQGIYLMRFHGLIGRVYHLMGDFEKSQSHNFQAKQTALQYKLYQDTINLNYEIGFNLAVMGDIDAGIRLIEQNLNAAKLAHNLGDIFMGYDNLSNLYAENKNPEKALELALELQKMPEAWEDDFTKAQAYEHLAEIYVKLKDWKNAQKYQRLALKITTELGMKDWIYECYNVQSLIDEGQGNFKSALANHKLYLALKDSVYQDNYDEKMAAMSALYDLETKQKTIELLEKDQQIKAAQIQEQRVLMFAGLLALLLIIIAIRFRNQQKTNRMREAFSQDLITAQEEERQRISKELHDSVGQNILFVKNRLQRLNPAPEINLIKSVDTALEDVRNIAKDLYPNQLEQYGLSSAVDSLCELAHESSGVFVSSDLQGVDEKLNRNAQINCYRIIQECLNNALKHAEASAIRITSTLHPNKLEFMVQDNGKGFDQSLLERKATRSFGMINIAERVKMLRGKLDLESAANKGTKLTFSIPV